MKAVMTHKRDQNGFTLVELLIVVVILAVLAAIVVFAVGSTQENSLAASCSTDAKAMQSALQEYKALVGDYPGGVTLQTSTPTVNPSPVPLPGYGQTWGLTTKTLGYDLPGTYGLLGNPTSLNGTWPAPDGQQVGPFLRQLPSTAHYQIVTDGNGQVFVYPGTDANAGPVDTTSQAMDNIVTVQGPEPGANLPNSNPPSLLQPLEFRRGSRNLF